MNGFQRNVLLPKWKRMCSEGPYDFVVVNGDLVDGLNYKERGMGMWTHSLDLQAENAAHLLNCISVQPEAPIYVIGGTVYHVEANPGIDQVVAEKLAALGKNVKYCGLEQILEIEKQKFHFSHWVSDSIYDGTSLSKEILMSKKHDIKVTGMFRGHRHHYGFYSDGFRFAAMLPAWKGRDAYVQKRGMRYATTQIGWVTLTVGKEYWNVQPTVWNIDDAIPTVSLGKKKETFAKEK